MHVCCRQAESPFAALCALVARHRPAVTLSTWEAELTHSLVVHFIYNATSSLPSSIPYHHAFATITSHLPTTRDPNLLTLWTTIRTMPLSTDFFFPINSELFLHVYKKLIISLQVIRNRTLIMTITKISSIAPNDWLFIRPPFFFELMYEIFWFDDNYAETIRLLFTIHSEILSHEPPIHVRYRELYAISQVIWGEKTIFIFGRLGIVATTDRYSSKTIFQSQFSLVFRHHYSFDFSFYLILPV